MGGGRDGSIAPQPKFKNDELEEEKVRYDGPNVIISAAWFEKLQEDSKKVDRLIEENKEISEKNRQLSEDIKKFLDKIKVLED